MLKFNGKNITYTIAVLSMVFMFGGIISLRYNGLNPYGAGIIFISIFLFAQYLKLKKTAMKELISLLTWVSVLGFLIVDVIIIWTIFSKG